MTTIETATKATEASDKTAETPKAEAKPETKGGTVTTLKPRSTAAAPAQQTLTKVQPVPGGGKLQTEADLDKAVLKAQKLKAAVAGGYYALGKHIKEIFSTHLWKQRTSEGKTKYTGFEQFCQQELKMNASTAIGLMDVADNFTEEQVNKFGTTKLNLVLKAPEEVRGEVLSDVEKGASVRELGDKVKEERAKKGNKRRETGRKKMPAGEKAAKKVEAAKGRQTITIANIEGRKTIKLNARVEKGQEPKRAKRIADQPWGTLELSNNVVMKFLVQDRDGELVLVVDTRRVDSAAE